MLLVTAALAGCRDHADNTIHIYTSPTAVSAVDLAVPAHPEVLPDSVTLAAAKNSWTQFVIQLDTIQMPAHAVLRLPRFQSSGQKSAVSFSAYQILSAPVDLNDAASVRQTGEPGRARAVPRVLLPLATDAGNVDLSAIRDPAKSGSVLIWIDAYIPADSPAGDFADNCELTDITGHQSAGTVPVRLTIEDLTLPAEPHLHFTAPLDWSVLTALHPAQFETLTPRLLSRRDPRTAAMLRLLDQYLQLAHDNKSDLYVTRLQPIVKWPLGKLPEVDWSDFDSIASGWCNGKAFSDRQPVAFWPLPAPDSLTDFDLASRIQYWHIAAEHFDQMQWLDRSPVVLNSEATGPITEADSILISAEARQILARHPRVGAMLPLQDDQAQLVSPANPAAISLESTSRLLTVAPGLVCASPIRDWPSEALPPRHWIDGSACLQTTGLASEQGIRSLAWLAFSRDASLILCGNPLPDHADPVSARQLIWCYPGEKFGVDHPLATVQLKWMREAEQDYEYLLLASQKTDRTDAVHMCRLITKPVQLQPVQKDEPLFNLLAGCTDPRASEEARQLLVSRMTSKATGASQVDLQTLRWFNARERPTLIATGAQWMWNLSPDARVGGNPGNWIDAQVDVDLYNPAEDMATGSQLEWTSAPGGWEIQSQPIDVPALAQYQVRRFTTTARFDLNKISGESRQPLELSFVDAFSGESVRCKVMLPVATSERRQQPINLDGLLDDWFPADAIQLDEPLTRMLNRPALQGQELQPADTPSSIYTSWSDENLYLAFRLGGVTAADLRSTRNFVQYDHGRAWGEDLCEMLIQPIYIDNTIGPTLHVVCKPGGNWVERQEPEDKNQTDPNPWQPFEACGIRYASGVEPAEKIWRGELAIPWKAIAAAGHGRPGLLRFNFIQHQNAPAQSASWAGPIDQSRDAKLAGLLLLKEP